MEIFIDDIPEEGLTVHADSAKDPWFAEVVKATIGSRFGGEDRANISVTLIKCEENVDITGEIDIVSHPSCDRCLNAYKEEQTIPFHILMSPLYESKQQENEEEGLEKELIKEDFEFSFYEGDRVDLSEIVREQIYLAEPFKHVCKQSCKGICQRCGKDLNKGPCGCKDDGRARPFSVLKDLKVKK